MSDNTSQIQTMSDDQELAKVLAGVTDQPADAIAKEPIVTTFVDTPPAEAAAPAVPETPVESLIPAAPAADDTAMTALDPIATPDPIVMPDLTDGSDDLETIKKDALVELRPLVDKLELSPEEKFDTYLLLLRSTDDKDLIAPAHEAAKAIADESRRAQALLDVIKEIDFLSGQSAA